MPTYTVYNASQLPVLATESWSQAVFRAAYLGRNLAGGEIEMDGRELDGDQIDRLKHWTAIPGGFRQPTAEELWAVGLDA